MHLGVYFSIIWAISFHRAGWFHLIGALFDSGFQWLVTLRYRKCHICTGQCDTNPHLLRKLGIFKTSIVFFSCKIEAVFKKIFNFTVIWVAFESHKVNIVEQLYESSSFFGYLWRSVPIPYQSPQRRGYSIWKYYSITQFSRMCWGCHAYRGRHGIYPIQCLSVALAINYHSREFILWTKLCSTFTI